MPTYCLGTDMRVTPYLKSVAALLLYSLFIYSLFIGGDAVWMSGTLIGVVGCAYMYYRGKTREDEEDLLGVWILFWAGGLALALISVFVNPWFALFCLFSFFFVWWLVGYGVTWLLAPLAEV